MSFSASALASLPFCALPSPALSLPSPYLIQTHLSILSLALKNSILTYSSRTQTTAPQPQPQLPPRSLPKEPTPEVIQILSDNEQPLPMVCSEIKQNKVWHPSVSIKKNELPPVLNPCAPKQSQLAPTSQDLHPNEIPPAPKPAKTKQIKKQKQERKESEFIVEVPEVDLLDCAQLPKWIAHRQWLGKKFETLMRRKVNMWVEPLKKQKKEVRLLKQ